MQHSKWQPDNDYFPNDSAAILKGALSGVWQYLATESPLEMMGKKFYFTSKAL